MKQLAYITQGHSEYDPRLRELLDATGIDPEEFIGLDYFSLSPFFALAGATIAPDAHSHGTDELHLAAGPGRKLRCDEFLKTRGVADQPRDKADGENQDREKAQEQPFPR